MIGRAQIVRQRTSWRIPDVTSAGRFARSGQAGIEARAADDRIGQAFLFISLGPGAGNTAKSGQENNCPVPSTQIPGPLHLITLAQTFRRSDNDVQSTP